jgi:hypothetical protein
MKLARSMETQCFASKYYGRKKGRYRCQYEDDHDGPHVDFLGREWQNRLPIWNDKKYVKRSEVK